MICTLIIDDELHNREVIRYILKEHCPNVEIIGEADSVKTGIKAISELKPDLVLLDIRLEDGNAFDLLDQVEKINFKIIFITAYEEYALKAIKFSALDYLLKPVTAEELIVAINKAENQYMRDLQIQLTELAHNLNKSVKKRIILRTAEQLHLIPVEDIVRCEADRNYSSFFLINGKKIVVSSPMKDFEDILTEQGFFRVHKSHIVNLNFVKSYIKSDGGYVLLTDGTDLPVSMRKKNQLMQLFENL
jgi:two-component system LytT family response regulator